jgi:hypothetical protein
MAPNPNIAPILFDRALLRARQSRALRSGGATFLLDRVAENIAERLHAVLREFKMAADIGTCGTFVDSHAFPKRLRRNQNANRKTVRAHGNFV